MLRLEIIWVVLSRKNRVSGHGGLFLLMGLCFSFHEQRMGGVK